MNRNAGRTLTIAAAAACLGLACAADSGDPLGKASNAAIGSSGSSGTSSGSSSGSSGVSSGGSGSGGGTGSSSGFSSGSSGGSSGVSSSGSGSGSSSGTSSSGSGDAAPDAPAGPSCVTTNPNSAAVAYFSEDTAASTSVQTVKFDLQLTNAGISTVSLSDVKVRYWFTPDGQPLSGIMFVSYYSANGNTTITADVHGTFMAAPSANVTATSNSYLELSFDAAAGNLMGAFMGGGAAKIQVAFFDPTYKFTMFNETNDYSFDPTKKSPTYQPTQTITAYVKGQLVWGCEPGAPGAGPGGSDAAPGG